MPATDAAPDPVTASASDERWQVLMDRIHDLEARVAATASTVNAALDAHLARLDALRRDLALTGGQHDGGHDSGQRP